MGRAFQTEIEWLNSTYKYIMESETKEVERFLTSVSNKPLLIVGSGGSYSAAKAFEYLYQKAGGLLAKSITPFELLNYDSSIKDLNIVLLTAGGNNPDTINAFKYISKLEPISFLTLCTNEKSKVSKIAEEKKSYILYQKSLPSGKDGFLAVNSLIAMILIIVKAYSNIVDSSFFKIEKDFNFLKSSASLKENIRTIIAKESIIVLHGGEATPVAVDIESKFTEAALGNVQLADFRNFAHGRHHWIAKNIKHTSIIALVSPKEKNIAEKTLALIPKDVPIYEIITERDSVLGIFELYREVFWLTKFAGELKNIDPGRPSVPEFGKKMYHLSFNFLSDKKLKALEKIENRAVYRKCSSINSDMWRKYKNGFQSFYKKIISSKFSGIIFDYDGTLKEKDQCAEIENEIFEHLNRLLDNGIKIGIATGRGKSVRIELQEKIYSNHWNNVYIAYYNGGEVATLNDNTAPKTNTYIFMPLSDLASELTSYLGSDLGVELRPKQLTIMLKDISGKITMNAIKEMALKCSNIKVCQSGHSLDIVPIESSKLNILKHFDQTKNYLCFGDSGQANGNDYELLACEYGISVNNVSASLDTCWNFAPLGTNNSRALLYYLNSLSLSETRELIWLTNILQ